MIETAIRYQKSYQWVAIFAVGFGALTILCAILEFVVSPDVHAILTWGEPVAGGLTLLLIGFGGVGKFKEKWLTARYKAENLRLLKFRKLTDARLWCPPIDMALLAEELQDEVRKLEAQNYEEAKAWSSQGSHPSVCGPPCVDTCDEALHELIEYYRPKRLHVQTERGLSRIGNPAPMSGRDQRRQQSCKQYSSRASHLSLAHIFVHKATEGQPSSADHHLLKQWLIGAAAGLPVIAAGVEDLPVHPGSSNEMPCGIAPRSIPWRRSNGNCAKPRI